MTRLSVWAGPLGAVWTGAAVMGAGADQATGLLLAAVGVMLCAGWGSGDNRSDALLVGPAIAAAPAALLLANAGVAPLGPALSGTLALTFWAVTCVCIQRLTAALAGGKGPGLGLAMCAGLLSIELIAQSTLGTAGAVLDTVSPGRALSRSAQGALDLRDLLVLLGPGLVATAWRAQRLSTADANQRLRLWLLPAVLGLALAVTAPIPLLVDIGGQGRFLLGPDRTELAGSIQEPVLLSFSAGPALPRRDRDILRAARDLMPGLRRAAGSMVTAEWLPVEQSGVQLKIRLLDSVRTPPMTDPGAVAWDLASALLSMRDGSTAAVTWVGAPPSPAQTASIRDAEVQIVPSLEASPGATAMVLRAASPLTDEARFVVDQHVMGGGGLLVLLGPGSGNDAPGARVVGAWGLGVGQPVGVALPGAIAGHGAVFGLGPIQVPATALRLDETRGLTERLITAGGVPVALALSGSVPSGVADDVRWVDRAPLRSSAGSVRVVALSDALASDNPTVIGPMLDWVLAREERTRMRVGVIKPASTQRRFTGFVAGGVVLPVFFLIARRRMERRR